MLKIHPIFAVFLLSAMFALGAQPDARTIQQFSHLPLAFERFSDQQFLARGPGYTVGIGSAAKASLAIAGENRSIGMEFIGGRRGFAEPQQQLPGKVNYYLGNNPKKWRTNIPTYARVTYRALYSGIDISYYGNQNQLEFDFILRPNADPSQIRMRFPDADQVRVDHDGNLDLGGLSLMAPDVFQGDSKIEGHYRVLANKDVVFEVGDYDRGQSLTIDPTLTYATRLGGDGGLTYPRAVAVDTNGNAYLAGYTTSVDFPMVNAPFPGSKGGNSGFIAKINDTGTALLYSTYIGGGADYLQGIAVGPSGSVWVTGYTLSSSYPVLNAAQPTAPGNFDAVVSKLTASGTLAFSTYLGGSSTDRGAGIALDASENAYVTGDTYSVNFPVTTGAYQTTLNGSSDAFVAKYTVTGGLAWATFLGGSSIEVGFAIATDAAGNSYITGTSESPSFPNAPPGGAYTTYKGGDRDVFVTKLNPAGTALSYFTFLGGTAGELSYGIAVEPSTGIAYIAGFTYSSDFPTSTGAYKTSISGGNDGFVAKLNATGSAFLYSTYLGGNYADVLYGITMDGDGNAYVAGYTSSTTFPTVNAIQAEHQGNGSTLFKSSDSGATWGSFDTHLPGAAAAISPDPSDPNILVAALETGIYRTTDGGTSWTLVGPNNSPVAGFSRSPSNPATIYAYTPSFPTVFVSHDDGASFVSYANPVVYFSSVVVDPLNPNVIYFYHPVAGLYKYKGFNNSDSISGSFGNAGNYTGLAAASDGTLWAGVGTSIYKSQTQGSSWILSTSMTVPATAIVVAPSDPSIIYVADGLNLHRTVNGGASWDSVPLPNTVPITSTPLAVSPTSPSTLYYGSTRNASQLYISTDSGATWTPSTGLGVAKVQSIAPSPATPATIYATSASYLVATLSKLDATGQNLVYSTMLGDGSLGLGVTVDAAGDAFVTGSVGGSPYLSLAPYTEGALKSNLPGSVSGAGSGAGFLARVSSNTASCAYTVDPQPDLDPSFTHRVLYSVTAPSGCAWTATTNQPWAVVESGASGTGSGVVYVLVNGNPSANITANVTIAGQAFTLTQRGSNCGSNVFTPSSLSMPAVGGTAQVNLAVPAGCPWKLVSQNPTALSATPASGTGPQTITVTVAPNLNVNGRLLTLASFGDNGTYLVGQYGLNTTASQAVFRDANGAIRLSTFGSSVVLNGGGIFASDFSIAEREGFTYPQDAFTSIVGRDSFDAVWLSTYKTSAQTWTSYLAGGVVQGTPAIAISPITNTPQFVARDNYDAYWVNGWDGSNFGTWMNLGGVFSTDPVIAACPDGSFYIVGKDNYNALWSKHYIPGDVDQSFTLGGGVVQGNPSVTCGTDNAAYIAVRDNYNSNWIARVSGNTWTGWFNGGAVSGIDPRIASLGGTLAIVTLDSTGAVYRNTFTEGAGNGWQMWTYVGGVLTDIAPATVGGELYFIGKAPDTSLWWWRQATGWSGIGNAGLAQGALAASPR